MKNNKILLIVAIAALSITSIVAKNHYKHSHRAQRLNRDLTETKEKQPSVSNAVAFSDIYEKGEWGVDETGKGNSGTGSDPENAKPYIEFLQNYLAEHKIHSVVDLGCGDWRIAQNINWDGIQYLGIDVVDTVISENIQKFSSSNISFMSADGTETYLPAADLLICKDVLQHLPFEDIHQIISQFGKFRYCIVINDVDPSTLTCENKDIPRGHYRFLDLTQAPFFLNGKKALTYISGANGEAKQLLIFQSKM